MYIVRSCIYVDYERTLFPRFFQTIICLSSGRHISLDDVCNVSEIKNKYFIQNVHKYRKSLTNWCDTKQKMINQYSDGKNADSSNTETNHESSLSQLPKQIEQVIRETDQQVEDLFVKLQNFSEHPDTEDSLIDPLGIRINSFENPVLFGKLMNLLQSSMLETQRLTENLEALCQKALQESTEEDKSQSDNDEYNLALLSDVW